MENAVYLFTMKNILSAIALIIILTGCSPSPSPSAPLPETQPAKSETIQNTETLPPTELTYWHTLPGPAGDAQDELATSFGDSQPGLKVNSVFQGSFYTELATKLLTAYVGKSAPEVSQLGTYEIQGYARSGVLVDLLPYINGADGLDTTDFPASLLAAGMVDNGVYWLPFNIGIPVLYYNVEAFKEAGITAPPQTWTEFYTDARKLTVRDDQSVVTRAGVAYWDMSWPMLSAIWSEGGDILGEDNYHITMDDPKTAAVLTEFQSLLKEGAATLPDKASGGHRAAFINGQAAMILDSPSPLAEIVAQAKDFTPGVAAYPAGAKGRVYAPGAGGLVMLSSTPPEKRELAWKFIKFMLSPQNLSNYAVKTGYVAYYPSAQKLALARLTDERYKIIYESVPYVRWDFRLYWFPPVRDAFEQAWQKIFFDMADVKQTLDEAQISARGAIEQ